MIGIITAGYSADGKYSHYLVVQAPMTVGDIALAPGSYVFGWQRTEDGLLVKFYEASSGVERGTAVAQTRVVGRARRRRPAGGRTLGRG